MCLPQETLILHHRIYRQSHIGYVIIDINSIEHKEEIIRELKAIPETIKARVLL